MNDLDTQTNINIGRTLATAMSTNDFTHLDAIINPNVTWHFPGQSSAHALAGDYIGFAGLTAFAAAVHRHTAGTFRMTVHDVYASPHGAVIAFTGHARRPDGRQLHNPTQLALRIHDGRVTEVREFAWDSATMTAFWQ